MNRKWINSIDAVHKMLPPRYPFSLWLTRAVLFGNAENQKRWISCSIALLRSHYDSLGVTPHATQNDIKQAYYKLSKLYHPDKNKGSDSAAEKFRDINAAYEVLGNYRLRKLYDKGILHTAGRHYANDAPSAAADQPEDDAQTRFYKKRMTRTHAPTMSGRTPIYDFDEWSRSHYGSRFEQKMKAEARFKRKAEREEIFKMRLQHEYIIFPLLFFCILYCVLAFQEASYDTPKPVAKSKEP